MQRVPLVRRTIWRNLMLTVGDTFPAFALKAVKGGLEIPAEGGGDAITIANAAVLVSLDDGK